MAVDRGYGTGKPRSAVNSRNRRRAAAGQLSKSKRGTAATIRSQRAKLAASPLGQFADTVLGFALPVGKVKAAAAGLRAAGKIGQASALEARVLAKQSGKELGIDAVRNFGPGTLGQVGPKFRESSTSVFPRLPSGGGVPGAARTFDKYYDGLEEGAGRFVSKKRELLKLKRQAGLTDPKNPNSTYPGVSGSTIGQFTKFPKRGR